MTLRENQKIEKKLRELLKRRWHVYKTDGLTCGGYRIDSELYKLLKDNMMLGYKTVYSYDLDQHSTFSAVDGRLYPFELIQCGDEYYLKCGVNGDDARGMLEDAIYHTRTLTLYLLQSDVYGYFQNSTENQSEEG